MELFEFLPKPKGDKKVLRELTHIERSTMVPKNFIFVTTDEQLADCVRAIETARSFVFDTETTGIEWTDYAVCLGIAVRTSGKPQDRAGITCWVIPSHMQYAMRNFTPSAVRTALGELFEDASIAKIGHNIKFDMHHMKRTYGVEVAGLAHDTMIAQSLLNENESHKLADIAKTWLQIDGWKFKQDGHFNIWPLKIATVYLAKDCETTLLLQEWQETIFETLPDIKKLYEEVEIPNITIAYEMEQVGIAWDQDYYATVMKPEVQSKRAVARAKVQSVIGPVNLDSPSQVAAAFFDGLHLERVKENALDKKVLSRLRKEHPVVADFETYRKYSTLDKMFVNELPQYVVDGRIHPNFRTNAARTGRWTCTDPNLQQLPKASVGPLIRRVFVPSRDHVLVTLDYGQVELRWLADFSGDEKLIAAFKSGEDIHTATCLLMFPHLITLAELKANKDHPLRVRAKTINFGILYGMGAYLLMETINAQLPIAEWITLDDAKKLIERWFVTFPGAKAYINATKAMVFKQGFVTTVLGRKRRLPDALSTDSMLFSMAERQAVNARIQGSAADLLKVAAIKMRQFLLDTHYPFRMLLAVHDELVLEVPREWLRHHEHALIELSSVMRNAMTLKVPLVVSVDVLSRWGDKIIDDDFYDVEEAA